MPHEYSQSGQYSDKTDSYAFGVVVLELLTGLGPKQVVGMMYDDAYFFSSLGEHKDVRAESGSAGAAEAAGPWPAKLVSGLAATAVKLLEFRPRNRARVRDVLPRLKALSREHGAHGGQ
jgi:hypothetical protein